MKPPAKGEKTRINIIFPNKGNLLPVWIKAYGFVHIGNKEYGNTNHRKSYFRFLKDFKMKGMHLLNAT